MNYKIFHRSDFIRLVHIFFFAPPCKSDLDTFCRVDCKASSITHFILLTNYNFVFCLNIQFSIFN